MANHQPVLYKYTSTKDYHDAFPCAYRQWRASSHCNQVHGYAFSFKFEFETDTAPLPSDFTYSTGSIDTPEGDYDFIDKIFFKGQPLEIEDYLDNSGKASSVMIFTLDGDTIK